MTLRALAKLAEAVRPNGDDGNIEIHHHGGGNVLGPVSVAHIAKLEKAEAKELATTLHYMYTVKFSVHKYNYKVTLQKKKNK